MAVAASQLLGAFRRDAVSLHHNRHPAGMSMRWYDKGYAIYADARVCSKWWGMPSGSGG
jgi:hypothetical protein